MALECDGVNVTVENNLFEYNHWIGNNMDKAMGGMYITSQTLLATKKYLGIPLRYQSFSPVSLREAQ